MKTRLTMLQRVNPERNEARFYVVLVGPSLVDEHAVMRIWGRLGRQQRHTVSACASADEAWVEADRLVQRRLGRGYRIVSQAEGER